MEAGYCKDASTFTPLNAANMCDHGAACAAGNFCIKSDFDSAGSTKGTAAAGGTDKSCDETLGAMIDTSTVCTVGSICASTALQCLWVDGTTETNEECTDGMQTCETTGCTAISDCHASTDVATPTSSQCLCNGAATEGNGFC